MNPHLIPFSPQVLEANADGLILEMDRDVVPIGEILQDRGMADRIVAPEDIEGLVGEDDAEAERVVGAIALIQRDIALGAGLFQQDREIEAGRPAAEN